MKTWTRLLMWVFGIVGAVLLFLYVFFFDVWKIPADDPMESASILPNLEAGDVVVLVRRPSVARGNLLRCPDPQAPGRFIIARAMGSFGDTVEIQRDNVLLDGKRKPSPHACDTPVQLVHDPQSGDDLNLHCFAEDFGERDFDVLVSDQPEPPTKAAVESGKWFLVSDDRHVHVDSRDFGQIDATACKHIVYRIVGAAGLGDAKRRFSVIW
jgi:signal peptidase I